MKVTNSIAKMTIDAIYLSREYFSLLFFLRVLCVLRVLRGERVSFREHAV